MWLKALRQASVPTPELLDQMYQQQQQSTHADQQLQWPSDQQLQGLPAACADNGKHGMLGERGTWTSEKEYITSAQQGYAESHTSYDAKALPAASMAASGAASYVLTASGLVPVQSSEGAQGVEPPGAMCESAG